MPHLYFNIRTGDDFIEDLEGGDFEDLEAARLEATEAAREIMSDQMREGRPGKGSVFEITDTLGKVVLVFPFLDAVSQH